MSDTSVPSSQATAAIRGQAQAISRLAEDAGAFDAAFDTFVAADRDGFRFVLQQRELVDQAEAVAEWFRAKWCVFVCLELCGPPPEQVTGPADLGRLAGAIGRITGDDRLLQAVVEGVVGRDADDFRAVVTELEIVDICHEVCSWVCAVVSARTSLVLTAPAPVEAPTAVEQVRSAGRIIVQLAAAPDALKAVEQAAGRLDCARVRAVLTEVGLTSGCEIICEWLCSWRCTWYCLQVCRAVPLPEIVDWRAEAREFALASRRLAEDGTAVQRLVDLAAAADLERWPDAVKELGFERYCVQLCRWVCTQVCHLFCACVCPPASLGIFTKIGGYYYAYDVDSGTGGTGLTNDNRAFFGTLRLNGGLALVDGAPPIEYRFETVPTDPAGTPTGLWTPVVPAQIAATNIGSYVRTSLPLLPPVEVWVNYPGAPPPHVSSITPAPDGWIRVPALFPFPGWEFVPSGDLVQLVSTTLQAFPAHDETGVVAGSSANLPLAGDVHYGIRMRLRDVGDTGDGADAGTCVHAAIDNTLYDHVSHHTYWDGGVGAGELVVASVGIDELVAAGCSDLTGSITVRFTAAHPNLGGVSLTLTGPGGTLPFALNPAAPATPGNWFGTGDPDGWSYADLPPCAYIVTLSVDALLTTGDATPGSRIDQIAFCKTA